jgi:amino acid transporter
MLFSYHLFSSSWVLTTQIFGPFFSLLIFFLIISFLFKLISLLQLDKHITFYFYLISVYYFISVLVFFILLFVTDPGIQYPNSHEINDENEEDIEQQDSPFGPHRIKRYCESCEIYQEDMKTFHCYECSYCIQERHHHCEWLGKCIGKNNILIYKVFTVLWITGLFYALLIFSIFTSNHSWVP